jgi:hypothetical protein
MLLDARQRVTPTGGAIALLAIAALLVLLIGPRHDHTAAIVLLAVLAAVLAVRSAGRAG